MSGSHSSLVSRIDSVAGDGIDAAVRAKHRWRLRRLGSGEALAPADDGLWAAGDRPLVLGELLAQAAERVDVRVLVWAGAPVPAFHPTRREVSDAVETLTRRTRIRCEPDPREHPFHCHHEKIVVVDGELAFVGGIDITDFGGDRYDVNEHPARRRLGWHDVGTRLRGPVIIDVHDHFALRRLRLCSEHLEVDVAAIAGDPPHKVVDERWHPIASEQLQRLEADAPATHRLLALPGVSRRSHRLLGPLVGLVDDG
jgi:phosphatidylserine/phosphatidylglycerophosphate/cardiolipin synthase-like enzyme